MNQELIGKFIAQCRKEKGLTQMQLAEKLNITNRAVSKWETGKSLPDLSIMPQVCEIFDITVNELLSGERIKPEDYQMKAEDNLIELFRSEEYKKKLKALEVVSVLLSISGFVICLSLPGNLDLNFVQDITMRIIGVFVWGCGIVVDYYVKKIRRGMYV